MNAKRVNDLHNLAMACTDQAFSARQHGDFKKALTHFQEAFKYESQAAAIVAQEAIEPTRSVLHRSAATLALDYGNVAEAERLVAVALEGTPPKEIEIELNELSEKIAEYKQRLTQLTIAETKQEFKKELLKALEDARSGNVHDISTLWDGIDDQESEK